MKNPEKGNNFLVEKKGFFSKNSGLFSSVFTRFFIGLFILLGFAGIASAVTLFIPVFKENSTATETIASKQPDRAVLAAATQKASGKISFNIPSFFNDSVTFQKAMTTQGLATFNGKAIFNNDIQMTNHNLDLGTGTLTASNVLYGVTAGPGITVSQGQTPIIANTGVLSLQGQTGDVQFAPGTGITFDGLKINNTGVTSVQGQAGAVSFTAGTGISIDGTTISSNAQSSNAFGTVSSGGTSFSAGSTNDTVTFTAGNGVTITPDQANKTLTFSSTAGGLSGLTTNGVLYATSDSTATSVTPGTSGFVLQSNGAGSPPSWVSNASTSPSFSVITSGTNTTAAMLVGSGASLNFTGTGTINASSVTGLTIASGKTFTVNNTLTFAGTDGTNFTLPSGSDTLVGRNSTDTLTNKTIAAGSNTITGLTNSNLSGSAGITNANLANSSVTVTAGTGLSGGGAVSLGNSVTLNNAGVLSLSSTQATVSASTGNITISLPQNIDTSASPTFGGLTLSGLGTGIVHSTAGLLSSSAINLNSSDVTGTLQQTNGGTGFATYTTGDILYASGANTLSKLAIGSSNQVLAVSGGVPSWSTVSGGSGGICSNCVVTNPTTSATNTIAPATTGVVGLTVKETSVGSADIMDLQNAGGSTTYMKVDQNGDMTSNNNIFLANGAQSNLYKIDTNGNARFALANTNSINSGFFNGNIISTGSGTLTLAAGKTVQFADSFMTSGANPLTLTTTAATNVTLPTTGTLITNSASGNQTITSTQSNGTLFNLTDTTNVSSSPIIGAAITLSGTGTEDQTGLQFNLSGASGANLNDIIGSGSTWKISRAGDATFNSITTNTVLNAASISSSGTFLAANGSAPNPSYSFTNSMNTGLFLPATNVFAISTNSNERVRVDANGNVGIGTTSPNSLLQVSGAVAGKALAVFDYTGTDQNIFVASKSGTTEFVIGNNGAITTGIWNGTAVDEIHGGTHQTSYTTGDILYASGTNTLAKLPVGSTGQALVVTGGVPTWSTIGGGSGCSDCVINDPSTSTVNTILPTAGSVTPLTLKAAPSGSNDIFDVKSNDGSTTYFAINSSGNISTGTWNGTAINETHGGTNQTSYTKGDILYASGANTLAKLPVGSSNQVLSVSSGVPVWSTVDSSLCSSCVITNPTTSLTNTIAPATTGVVGLTLKETSVGSADIMDIQNAGGSTTYMKVDQNGDLTSNNNIFLANGAQSNLYKIDTNGNGRFALLKSNDIESAFFNGNIISTGSGTLTLGAGKTLTANSSLTLGGTDGKTLTVNDNTTLSTGSMSFSNGSFVSFAANKNVTFADAFTTSGTNPLTLTTTGSTNVTLPTTGTLLTNTAAANQTITSTQTSGTILGLTDSTNIASAIVGQAITLSGTGAFDQTGLQFNLSGASGSNLNDILGSSSTWKVSTTGAGSFASLLSNGLISANGGVTVANGQNLTLAGITGNNAVLYATAGTGVVTSAVTSSADQCLLSGAGNAPAWGACALGTNYWQLSGSTISPLTQTNGFAVGTTTRLAGTDLRSLSGTQATASISGATSFAGLVVDNSGVGDIFTASSSGLNRFVINQNGNVGIGTTATSNFLLTVNGGIGPVSSGVAHLGTTTNYWGDFIGNYAKLQTGLAIGSFNPSEGGVGANGLGGGTSPIATISANTSYAAFVVDNKGVGDIFTASSSGLNRFVITQNGGVGIGTASVSKGILEVHQSVDSNSGGLAITNASNNASLRLWEDSNGYVRLDAGLNATGNISLNGAGTGAVGINTTLPGNSALVVNQPNSSGDIFSASQSGNTKFVINNAGNVGIGTNSPGAALDVNGNLLLGANSTIDTRSSGSLTIGNGSNTTGLTLGKSGVTTIFNSTSWTATPTISGLITANGGLNVASGQNLTLAGITGNNAVLYATAGTGVVTSAVTSSANQCLLSGAGNAPSWGSCGGTNYWQLTGSVISQATLTNTVSIGATTSLGTLDVRNLNGTLATASISGKTSFAALTVDNSGVGDLFTASSSGLNRFVIKQNGNVGIGTTAPVSLLDVELPGSTTGTIATFGNISGGPAGTIGYTTGGGNPFTIKGFSGNDLALGANGAEYMRITQAGNIGIGTSTPLSSFNINSGGTANADVFTLGNTTTKGLQISDTGAAIDLQSVGVPLYINNTGEDTYLNPNAGGNVGIGTSSPVSKLDVEGGNIMIGQQTNTATSADTTFTKVTQSTAGTIASGDSFNIASISASVVYNGSLYIGTYGQATGSAEVYRYNGSGTNWSKVSQPTPGKIASGGTANIASVSAMIVYNGNLYIGTSQVGGAEIYQYNGGTSWTKVSQAAGTIRNGGTTGINGVVSMAVWAGKLYVGTSLAKKGEFYRYEEGTNWNLEETSPGTICGQTNVDAITTMTIYNGLLWVALAKGNTGALLCEYQATNQFIDEQTGGSQGPGTIIDLFATVTFNNLSVITSMVDYNGHLFLSARSRGGTGGIFEYEDTGTNGTTQDFSAISSNTQGSIGSTTGIDGGTIAVYNGKLYVGTEKAGSAEIYRFDGGFSTRSIWTKVSSTTAGTIGGGGTSGINMISTMIPYNGNLYIGTYKVNGAEMYSYNVVSNQSYALQFHAGTTQGGGEQNNLLNIGTIVFQASPSANASSPNGNNTGQFVFSNGIVTSSNAYDYAEDYPTRDDTLAAGDIVALDTSESGMVKKATQGDSLVGVYSTNPGMDLSQKDTTINGGRAIPVALTGRVPMKVSTESGAINIGDLLTTSSQPGIAMKATKPGFIIGKAMEQYNGDGVSTIMTYVNVTWADPGIQLTTSGDLNIANNLPAQLAKAPSMVDTQAVLGENTTPDATTSGLASASATMTDSLSQLGNEISLLKTQYASLSAKMSKLDDISTLSQKVAVLEQALPLFASSSGSLTNNDATISGQLAVTGKTLLSDVGITGKVSMGLLTIDGMGDPCRDATSCVSTPAAAINTLSGPLKFQSLALNGIDFENGKITIDTDGNFITQGAITAKKYNVDTSDQQSTSLGEATLPAGETTVAVDTTAVTNASKIFVTSESVIAEPLTVTKKTKGKSFTVQIAIPAEQDVKFTWWIVN